MRLFDKIVLLISTIMILASAHSCSKLIRTIPKHKGIDPAFKAYASEFTLLTGKKLDNFSMGFANLPTKGPNQIIGMCWPTLFLRGEVDIDKGFWQYTNKLQRRSLILHELGHCVCLAAHDTSLYNNGCPKSHMFPTSVSTWCIKKHGKQMDEDLIKKCK